MPVLPSTPAAPEALAAVGSSRDPPWERAGAPGAKGPRVQWPLSARTRWGPWRRFSWKPSVSLRVGYDSMDLGSRGVESLGELLVGLSVSGKVEQLLLLGRGESTTIRHLAPQKGSEAVPSPGGEYEVVIPPARPNVNGFRRSRRAQSFPFFDGQFGPFGDAVDGGLEPQELVFRE